MNVRQDYYKFAHFLLPDTALKNKKIFIDRAVSNPGLFIFGLKNSWYSIQVDNNQKRSPVPEFEVETFSTLCLNKALIKYCSISFH